MRCTSATSTTSCATARSSSSTSSPAAPCRAALVRRPAPGGRGQGRRARPAREPDARLDHLPELLPHVQEAGGHDRHGRHRGLRVPADLRPGSGGHPDHRPMVRKDMPIWCTSPQKTSSSDHRGHQGLRRARPAGAGRHHLDRDLGAAVRHAEEGGHPARGAERQAARARSADRRPGRPPGRVTIATNMAGRGTDIVLGGNSRPSCTRSAEGPGRRAAPLRPSGRSATTRCWPPAACTSSAPSATSRGASTTSCAAVPAARATRVPRRFYLSLEDNLMRIFAVRPHQAADAVRRHEGRRGHREHAWSRPDRERAAQGRGAQLRHPQATCSNSTTSPTTSAR
jgi:hypothetical protein